MTVWGIKVSRVKLKKKKPDVTVGPQSLNECYLFLPFFTLLLVVNNRNEKNEERKKKEK